MLRIFPDQNFSAFFPSLGQKQTSLAVCVEQFLSSNMYSKAGAIQIAAYQGAIFTVERFNKLHLLIRSIMLPSVNGILHVKAKPERLYALVGLNNIYVSCEQLFNPKLKGIPLEAMDAIAAIRP